ncbi:MAG: ArsR/SmtB family transcription factor [Acetobacteraceae bacterium]
MNANLVFRALADPARRRLLDHLFARNGQTLGELCGGETVTRQAMSRRLAILEHANLVVAQKRGREKCHFLHPVPIHEIAERRIAKHERAPLGALADLKKSLAEANDGRE